MSKKVGPNADYRHLVKCPYCEEVHDFETKETQVVMTCRGCNKEFLASKKWKKESKKPRKIKGLTKLTKKTKKVS